MKYLSVYSTLIMSQLKHFFFVYTHNMISLYFHAVTSLLNNNILQPSIFKNQYILA